MYLVRLIQAHTCNQNLPGQAQILVSENGGKSRIMSIVLKKKWEVICSSERGGKGDCVKEGGEEVFFVSARTNKRHHHQGECERNCALGCDYE